MDRIEPGLAEAHKQCANGKGHGGDTTFTGLVWGQSAEALL